MAGAFSKKPAPVVFYIHGGGWQAQNKTDIHQHLDVRALTDAGISVASVNYCFLQDANAAKIALLVAWPLGRCAMCAAADSRQGGPVESRQNPHRRQRGHAPAELPRSGSRCMPTWPIRKAAIRLRRAVTRLCCVAVKAPVVSLDPQQLRQWIPNAVFAAHAFGYANLSRAASFEPFLAARESYLDDIRRYSPYELAGKDAPPLFMEFPMQDKPPVPGDAQTDPSHSAVSGLMLQRKLESLGVAVELQYPGALGVEHADVQDIPDSQADRRQETPPQSDLIRPGKARGHPLPLIPFLTLATHPMKPIIHPLVARPSSLPAFLAPIPARAAQTPIDIGSRRELFVDRYLIERLDNVRLRDSLPCGVRNE